MMDKEQLQTQETTLRELFLEIRIWFKYLRSNWITILSIALLGGILGFVYANAKKPTYTATTTFVLDEGDKGGAGLSGLGGIASIAGISLNGGGGLFQGDNILELYKSRAMIKKALLSKSLFNHKETLIDEYIRINELKNKWNRVDWNVINFADTSNSSLLRDSVLIEVTKEISKSNLSVSKPDKKLSIIQVDFKGQNERFAKEFCDKIVKSVNEFYIKTRTARSEQNVNILQFKTDSVRKVMNGAISNASSIVDETPNLNPTRQSQRNIPVQRSQFSIETNKAVLSVLLQNLEMAKVNLMKETPLIQVVDEPTFPLDKTKLGKLKGIVFGGLLAGSLAIIILIIKKILQKILKEQV